MQSRLHKPLHKLHPTKWETSTSGPLDRDAGVIPFAIGSYEFGKRILIQLRCAYCDVVNGNPFTRFDAAFLPGVSCVAAAA